MATIKLNREEISAVADAVRFALYGKTPGSPEHQALLRSGLYKLDAQLQWFAERDEVDCVEFEHGDKSVLSDCSGIGHYLCPSCCHYDDMDTRTGPAVISKEQRIELVPVTEDAWNAMRARESETATHPCTTWRHEACDCRGACSCHWKQDK